MKNNNNGCTYARWFTTFELFENVRRSYTYSRSGTEFRFGHYVITLIIIYYKSRPVQPTVFFALYSVRPALLERLKRRILSYCEWPNVYIRSKD